MGFFPVDDKTIDYFRGTGRTAERDRRASRPTSRRRACSASRKTGEIDYTEVARARPRHGRARRSPARSARRTASSCGNLKSTFTELFSQPVADNGFAKKPEDLGKRYHDLRRHRRRQRRRADRRHHLVHQHLQPGRAARRGLLAKKAVETRPDGASRTSRPRSRPGSRVVTEYLTSAGLLPYLEKLGFYVVGYGCTTCIGNAGPARRRRSRRRSSRTTWSCAAVLSGNRNFEARIHPNIRANFLASPAAGGRLRASPARSTST